MRTITFYSYNGGVGRTLAAANFGLYLARAGKSVVLMDFDLEAPGLDSKFDDISPEDADRGLLDYILEYQESGEDPGPVSEIMANLSLEVHDGTLTLIAAGDYAADDYGAKLERLSWTELFSEDREGVAFFQDFLHRIEAHAKPDFLIIDSRTGLTEIGGLCTQQLADEVVMLTCLSGEGIKMTRHIADLIRNSPVAEKLGKDIDVKIVVSRVPRPDDLDAALQRCSDLLDIDEKNLFFLFSSQPLEWQEFLAVSEPTRDEHLLSAYVNLFQGLNVEI